MLDDAKDMVNQKIVASPQELTRGQCAGCDTGKRPGNNSLVHTFPGGIPQSLGHQGKYDYPNW
jgi:hypothetical protein